MSRGNSLYFSKNVAVCYTNNMGSAQSRKIREELGHKLKQVRERKNLTQSELAERAGINANYYAKLERGEVNFSVDKLYEIVKALNLKSSDILPF